ncbi:ABC transporter ATP-binding protein [Candidatus Methylopumilus planktonicus]|uniref:ABC transporter ATP-binding protein n=1 Tax=Candidatus Methylopumilus planktonicus TaxID=1581557 RepID=UPI00111F02CC|nr:ABC transporter ATP-binding protein [Candidatus Methylopumilus planktonicus]QDD00462.1 ABC transporter ATP-binding protein [Candidatus Methylopumilus planktonicus]
MNKFQLGIAHSSIFTNIYRLFLVLSPRRRIEIYFLLILQALCAIFEVMSIGSIIPFINALTNTESLMQNVYISLLMKWLNISNSQQLILTMAIIFTSGIFLTNIIRFATLFAQQYLSAAITVDIGKSLTLKILSKPFAYFLNKNTSEIIGNTTNDLDGTATSLISVFNFLISTLISATILCGLIIYNPKLTFLLFTIILGAYSLIMFFVNRYLRLNSILASNSYQNIIKSLQEACGGIRYIILGQLQNYFTDHFSRENKAFRYRHATNGIILQAPRLLLESIAVFMISGVAIFFVLREKNIATMIPLMGFLVFSCYRLLPLVQQMYSSIGSIIGLSASVERILDLLVTEETLSVDESKKKPLLLKNRIDFDRVFFKYNDLNSDWTIKNVTFSIKAKTTVALVGQTGSGKSTISDLILGLISNNKGSIKIDDQLLNKSNMNNWQATVAHVPQSIFLSDATITENVAFGIPPDQIDMNQVKKVCKIAQISDFIETLNKKYDERVGERGVRLSGGQRQRIGIARALYKNPDLIVFDEATSALDNQTEREVVAAIDKLEGHSTIILIAHRISTVKRADNILLFENGRLLAQGNYEQLLNNNNFKKLVNSNEFIS